jgi:hypothetical protein
MKLSQEGMVSPKFVSIIEHPSRRSFDSASRDKTARCSAQDDTYFVANIRLRTLVARSRGETKR